MKKIYIILILLWFGITFSFSSDQKVETRKKSEFFVEKIYPIGENVYGKAGKPIPDKEKIGKVLRKTAHFLNYALLGMLVILGLKKSKSKTKVLIVILVGFIFASLDEFHQTFVPGRDGNIIDVFIDISGVGFGLVLINAFKLKDTVKRD